MSDVPSHSASSTRRHNGDDVAIGDRIVTSSPVLFVPGDLTPFPTIKVPVRQ